MRQSITYGMESANVIKSFTCSKWAESMVIAMEPELVAVITGANT